MLFHRKSYVKFTNTPIFRYPQLPTKPPSHRPTSVDRPNNGSVPGTGNSSPLSAQPPAAPVGLASQTGRGTSVVSIVTGLEVLMDMFTSRAVRVTLYFLKYSLSSMTFD